MPKEFNRIDLVADTYRECSIKSAERIKRGVSSRTIVGSIKSKLPRDINQFLHNDDNKRQLITMVFQYITENRVEVTKMLKTEKIVLPGDNKCYKVTIEEVAESNLKSNQEEADTKVVLNATRVLETTDLFIVLRSPSGDTDILALLLALIKNDKSRVFYACGNGVNRKGVWLNLVEIEENKRNALIGFHSFTGNDFVSSFFRKGKKHCWEVMIKNEKYLECFTALGKDWEPSLSMMEMLQHYVCSLFGSREKEVNKARFEIFNKKYTREGKTIDLSALPPCESSL